MPLRKILQLGLGALFVGLIVSYAGYQFQDFWRGPTIVISSPQNGAAFDKPLIEITGTAERIAYLSLNDRQIYTNQQGEFREQLLLSPGYNIITVSAEDKFNRTTETRLQLMLSGSSTDFFSNYGQKQ